MSHPFVLRLAFAVAGYHLAYLRAADLGQRQRYVHLAELHASEGLAELAKVLPNLDESNCRALYVSATLVCYCTLAAGPTGPDDLLVCSISDDKTVSWLPLIHGVRLIHKTIDHGILFSELTAPLGPSPDAPGSESGPTCALEGFPRISWQKPLHKLRRYISSSESPNRDTYLRSFDTLSAIYEATFGTEDGSYDGPPENRFVFGWLYRLDKDLAACLSRKEPLSLLLLSYYALLFKTMAKCWFLDGWADHILTTTRTYLGQAFMPCLRWPMEQAGLQCDSDCNSEQSDLT